MKERNQQNYLAMFNLVNAFIEDEGFHGLNAQSFYLIVEAISENTSNKIQVIKYIREVTVSLEKVEFKLVSPLEEPDRRPGVPSLFTKWAKEKNVDLSSGMKPTPVYMGLKSVKDIYEFIQLNIDLVN